MNFKSECLLFGFEDLATAESYWSYAQADQDTWNNGYRIRDPKIEFEMPKVRPILPSAASTG